MSKARKISVAVLLLAAALFIAVGLSASVQILSTHAHLSNVPKECSDLVERLQTSQDKSDKELEDTLRKFYGQRQWILFAGGVALGIAVGLLLGMRKRSVQAESGKGNE